MALDLPRRRDQSDDPGLLAMGKLDQLPRAGKALDGAEQRLDRPRLLLSGEDKILAGETGPDRRHRRRRFRQIGDGLPRRR